MNWFQQLQYRTKIGVLLTALIGIILLNNITGQQSFDDMGNSVSTLYKDRLMPATYIFELTDHLYQQQLLHTQSQTPALATQLTEHQHAIAALIKKYEATHLTKAERIEWTAFKSQLAIYNAQSTQVAQTFSQMIFRLNALSNIQAGEGNHLQQNTSALLNASSLRYSLEMGLIIVLAAITLVVIGASQKAFVPNTPHRPSLN